jgi:hypothetical protein
MRFAVGLRPMLAGLAYARQTRGLDAARASPHPRPRTVPIPPSSTGPGPSPRAADDVDAVDAILWNGVVADRGAGADASWSASLLDQYKLYVEMSDRIGQRRVAASTYFLSVNSAILGLVGYLTSTSSADGQWILALAGIVLCMLWRRLIRSYRDINAAKLLIVHRIEKRLPISPYDAEWEALGRGIDPRRYQASSQLEAYVPLIFGALHVAVLLRAILGSTVP